MFSKFIIFEINKRDTTKVIDTLSKYKRGLFNESDLSIVDNECEDKDVYCVSLHCRKNETENCLSDILSLVRKGVEIYSLDVI